MATIKSYTDIEQSKKLAEILPLESADMCYMYLGTENKEYEDIPICAPAMEGDLCAWSFAALFGVLPDNCGIDKEDGKYVASYLVSNECGTYTSDNTVDACYKMIIYLHELKML